MAFLAENAALLTGRDSLRHCGMAPEQRKFALWWPKCRLFWRRATGQRRLHRGRHVV